MKKYSLKDHATVLIPRLYAFAFVLLPEEAHAQRLLNDALTLTLLKHQDEWNEFSMRLKKNGTKASGGIKKKIFDMMLASMYSLAQKRMNQVAFKKSQPKTGFYSLPVSARAVVYLRFKLGMNHQDTMNLLQMNFTEITQASLIAFSTLQELPPEINANV